MGATGKTRQNSMAEALLSIYEAKDIMRDDQRLFHETLSDLKSRVNPVSEKNDECCSYRDGLTGTEAGSNS